MTPVAAADLAELSALINAGRFADLEARARGLLERHPDSGVLTKVLALALWTQGKDALPSLTRATQLLPDDPEAHGNLGNALRAAGRSDAAVRSQQRVLEIDPANAPAHNNLGSALLDLGRLEEAATCFRRAVALQPGFALAHANLGNVLLLQNRSPEAEVSCRRALELDPHLTLASVQLAEILSGLGDFAAAESFLKRALGLDPEMPEAWAGLARLKKMTLDDAAWLGAAQRIADSALPPRREIPLRFALGKYFDDVSNFDEAFEHYRRANELAKAGSPAHDPAVFARAIERIVETHDRSWLSRSKPDDADLSRLPHPVCIVGMPRSGTTLAEQILAAHSQVHGAGELPFWSAAASRYEEHRSAGAESERNLLARLGREYLAELRALAPDATWVVDKMPANFLYVGLIHAALPTARFIHLWRDPLDTCVSVYFQHFGAGHTYATDLDSLGHYYTQYLRLMDHWRKTLPLGAMLEVGYEDLVGEPERWARRMVEFLELPWDPAVLEFHRGNRPVNTLSKWQARQRINTASVGRWRHYSRHLGPLRRWLEPASAETA